LLISLKISRKKRL